MELEDLEECVQEVMLIHQWLKQHKNPTIPKNMIGNALASLKDCKSALAELEAWLKKNVKEARAR